MKLLLILLIVLNVFCLTFNVDYFYTNVYGNALSVFAGISNLLAVIVCSYGLGCESK